MQWGMDLVPGLWGELDRKLILDEVKNPPFRPQHSFDLFVYLQHLFAANWVCFQGKLWRASFKMPQKTQTCLWQRGNCFCLRHFCVILVFQYQLCWLLPAWSRKEREINQQIHDGTSTGTSLSVPFLSAQGHPLKWRGNPHLTEEQCCSTPLLIEMWPSSPWYVHLHYLRPRLSSAPLVPAHLPCPRQTSFAPPLGVCTAFGMILHLCPSSLLVPRLVTSSALLQLKLEVCWRVTAKLFIGPRAK